MEISISSIKAKYNEKFNSKNYYAGMNGLFLVWKENFELMLQFLSYVVESGMFKGCKVLEIGSGSSVHGIAAASGQYSCIVQTDYVLDTCEELKKWHRGESRQNWSQFLEVALKIEQKGKPFMTLAELEARIRNSVKRVVHCDVQSDSIVQTTDLTTDTNPPYDLVITLLCLENAAQDLDNYVAILKRINKLIRTGGGLVVCGCENGSTWKLESETFHHLRLSMAHITRAMEEAGFRIRCLKTRPKSEDEGDEYVYDSFFCIAVEKK